MSWKDNVYDETKFHKPLEKTRSQQDIEDNLMSLKTCFAGENPPSNPEPGQLWLYTPQTGDWILKQRNKENTVWIDVFILKESESTLVGVNALLRRGSDDLLYWRSGDLGKAYLDYYDFGHSDGGVFGFSLTPIPQSFQISRNSNYQFTVRITPTVSLNGNVTLSFSPVPDISFQLVSGAVPVPGGFQAQVYGLAPVNVVFNAVSGNSVPLQNFNVSISGTYTGSGTYLPTIANMTIMVVGIGFNLSVSPDTVSTSAGSYAIFDLTVSPVGGFTGIVDLSHSFGSNFVLTNSSVDITSGPVTVQARISASSSLFPNIYRGYIIGSSGSIQASCPFNIVITGVSSFYLMVSPSSFQIGKGKSKNFTVTVVPTGGFTGQVNLSITQVSGFTFSIPSPINIVGASPANVNCSLSVSDSVGTNTYSFVITGVSDSILVNQNLYVEVVNTGFSLSVNPNPLSISSGGVSSFIVTATGRGGFTGTINLSITPSVPGITFTLNPITISEDGSGFSMCYVNVSSTIGSGVFPFQINGVSGLLSSQTSLNLNVQQVGFSVSVSPASLNVPLGSGINFNVVVTPVGGFTGLVNFSTQFVFGNPPALTFNIPSANIIDDNPVVVVGTVTANEATNAVVNIIGNSGSRTSSASLTVNVAYVGFSLSCNPSSANAAIGSSINFTLNVIPSGGFTGLVNFSVTPITGFNFVVPSANITGPNPVSVNCSVSIDSSVSPNNYTFNITGVSGTKTAQAVLTLNVVQAGYFQISVNPSQVDCYKGSNASFSVTVTPRGGFTGTVMFSSNFSGMSLSIPNVNIIGSSPVTVTGVVNVSSQTQAGIYNGIITGSSSGVIANVLMSIRVIDAGFILSGNPTDFSGFPGKSLSISVTVTPQGSFSGTVSFSVSIPNVSISIPSVNVSGSPVTVTGTLTILTGASIGNMYSGYITGTSGSIQATVNIRVSVTEPFVINVSPESLSTPKMTAGTTELSISVTIMPYEGFVGTVNVSGSVSPYGSYFSVPSKNYNINLSPVTKSFTVTITWTLTTPPVRGYNLTLSANWSGYVITRNVPLEITAPYQDYSCYGGGPCSACSG